MGISGSVRNKGNSRLLAFGAAALLSFVAPYANAETFTVGGSISNLTGSGLVLQLDTQAAVCVAPFNIVVGHSSAAEPANEACLRARNQCCSDTDQNEMDSVDENGNHTCTAICGSVVAGIPKPPGAIAIAGSTQANPPQTVSPTAGAASYVFPVGVDDNSTYTISINSQPSNPAQVCAVANPNGKLSGGNVTNANVSCTTVTHTVTATAGTNGTASPSSQSVNDGSNAIVTLAPATGFTGSASGCGGSLGGDGVTYTTGIVTADCTVTATFTAIPKTPTTTTLTLSPNPTIVAHAVTASVVVSNVGAPPDQAGDPNGNIARAGALAAVPTGTVSVSGGSQSCTATLVNGSGSCALTYATPGTFAVVATYGGDAQNLGSTGNGTLVVAAPAPVTPEPSPTLSGLAQTLLGVVLIVIAWFWRRNVKLG